MEEKVCCYCGEPFTQVKAGGRPQRTCGSAECQWRLRQDGRKAWKAANPEKVRTYRAKDTASGRSHHNSETLRRERRERRRRRAIGALETAALGFGPGGCRFVGGICHHCGRSYVGYDNGCVSRHCSDRCKRAVKQQRRRARKAGVHITAVQRWWVFERDNWVCQICGEPVNRKAEPCDMDAPVLDHVIPLARGGAHSMANLQTAHFYCNCVKRDTDLCLIA